MNWLARELIMEAGGEVLGERYRPLEETAVERIVLDIEQRRPSFILNNLIGPSSYAFLAAIHALGQRDPAVAPENCPVVSCDLTECELEDGGTGIATGQLAASVYFDSVASPEKSSSRRGWRNATGTDDPLTIRPYLSGATMPRVLGPISIDPDSLGSIPAKVQNAT